MGVGGLRPGSGTTGGAAGADGAASARPAAQAAPPAATTDDATRTAPAPAESGGRAGISGQFSAAALAARMEGGLGEADRLEARISTLEGKVGELDRKVADAENARAQAERDRAASEAAARKPVKDLAKDYDAANGARDAEVRGAKAEAEQRLGLLENRLLAVNARLRALDEEPGGSSPTKVDEYVKLGAERKGLEGEIVEARGRTAEARKAEAALPKTPEQKAKVQKAEYESRAGRAKETASAAGAAKSGAEAERAGVRKDLAGARSEQAAFEKARNDMDARDAEWRKANARAIAKGEEARKTEAENRKAREKEYTDVVKLAKDLGVVKLERREIPGIPIYDKLPPVLQILLEETTKTPVPIDLVKGVGEGYNLVLAYFDPRTNPGQVEIEKKLRARGMNEGQVNRTMMLLQQLVRGELRPPE